MTNDRLKVPQDSAYFQSTGLAIIAFARLEWDAVWCCERLLPSYIDTIEIQKKTAGIIASDLKKIFFRIPDTILIEKIIPFADEFEKIVQERNGLLHGKPMSDLHGNQRLCRHSFVWTVDAVDSFADRCTRTSASLNSLLYNELREPCRIILKPD